MNYCRKHNKEFRTFCLTCQMEARQSHRVDEVALRVMREQGHNAIWYGNPDLICEISEKAGCKQGHPLNKSAAVMQAIARSPKFKKDGFIRHLGRRYNVYIPAKATQ